MGLVDHRGDLPDYLPPHEGTFMKLWQLIVLILGITVLYVVLKVVSYRAYLDGAEYGIRKGAEIGVVTGYKEGYKDGLKADTTIRKDKQAKSIA